MLSDFIEEDDSEAFLDEIAQEDTEAGHAAPEVSGVSSSAATLSAPRLFGMTPFQRLVIVLMLFLWTLILGSFCLLVTGIVVPPFLF